MMSAAFPIEYALHFDCVDGEQGGKHHHNAINGDLFLCLNFFLS